MHAEPDLFPPDPFEQAAAVRSQSEGKKRKNGKSPNARSMEIMRKRGYLIVEKVEQRIPGTFITKDFAGIADICAIRTEAPKLVLVQATSLSNIASRITKVTDHANTPILRQAGFAIYVHGWAKGKDGKWRCREVNVS
jgi:hypothetical protein